MKKHFLMLNKRLPVLFCTVLCFCHATAPAQKPAAISEQLGSCINKTISNPFSTLAEEELANLSFRDLRLLENFIYTRRFTELRYPSLSNYFAASDKTLTLKIKQDSNFIRSTVYNLELLQAFSNADSVSLSNKEQFDSTLHGYWQQGTSVIAGELLTNYHFLQNDHSFMFEYKTENKMNRLVNYSGFYTFTNNGIELEIRTKTILKGGSLKYVKTPSGKTKTWLSGAKETTIHLEEAYEYIPVNIGPVYSIRFDGIQKMYCRINGKIFWKCYPPQ